MRSRAKTLLTVIGLAGALCLIAATPALTQGNGEVKTVETFPLEDFGVVNACSSSELVALSGEVVFETKTHTDADGTTHISEVLTITGTGVGNTSGASYTLDDVTHTKIKIGDPFPYSFRERRVSDLTGDGVPDMLIRFDTVLTFDADGNIKHDLFEGKLICSP